MSDKKDLDDLESVFKAGDAWLMKYGAVTPMMHNNIILNLYMNFPKVKYVEYVMNQEERSIKVIMHFSFLSLLFRNKENLIDSIIDLLKDYLHDYNITVELKRYKKGVKNEKPTTELATSATYTNQG